MHKTSFQGGGLLLVYLVCLLLNFVWFKEIIAFGTISYKKTKNFKDFSFNDIPKKEYSTTYLLSHSKISNSNSSYNKNSQEVKSAENTKLANEEYLKGKKFERIDQLDSAKQYIFNAISKVETTKSIDYNTLDWIIDLGLIYQKQDSVLLSIECYKKAIKIIEKIPKCDVSSFSQNFHQAYSKLAEIYSTLGLKQEARFYSDRALEKSTEIGLARPIVQSIIDIINYRPTIEEIEVSFNRGFNISKNLNDSLLSYQLLQTISQVYIDSLQLELAHQSISKNYDIVKKLKDNNRLNEVKFQEATLFRLTSSFMKSLQLTKELQQYYEAYPNSKFLEQIYHNLSLNFESIGQIDSSFYYAKRASLQRKLLNNDQYILSTINKYLSFEDKQKAILKRIEQQNLENLADKAEIKAKRSYYIAILSVIFSTLLLLAFGYLYVKRNCYTLKLKSLNESLRTEEKKLDSTNKKLINFSNVISHDILSNLYIVLSARNIFRNIENQEENLKQYFTITQQTSIELTEYCINLLKETQSVPSQKHLLINPNPVLEKVLNRYKNTLLKHNFTVKTSALSGTYLPMAILEQIFQNIISNAIRYASSSSKPRIEIIEKIIDANYLEWHFKDNGPGITDSIAKQLFLLKKKDTKVDGGQQMGLALLKESLNNEGANIFNTNNNEGGACFVIQIPNHETSKRPLFSK